MHARAHTRTHTRRGRERERLTRIHTQLIEIHTHTHTHTHMHTHTNVHTQLPSRTNSGGRVGVVAPHHFEVPYTIYKLYIQIVKFYIWSMICMLLLLAPAKTRSHKRNLTHLSLPPTTHTTDTHTYTHIHTPLLVRIQIRGGLRVWFVQLSFSIRSWWCCIYRLNG